MLTVALLTVSAGVANAVATRNLAAGNTLYAFDGSGSSAYGTLLRIDALTGSATAVGTRGSESSYNYPYQAAYNPQNDSIYWIGVVSDGEILMKANPTTGQSVQIGEFKEGGTNVTVNSMAISSAGAAFGIAGNKLYSINLSNATLTLVGSSLPYEAFYAFAYNPKDSKFYAVSTALGAGLYEINVSTGAATLVLATTSFPDLGAGTGANARRLYSIAFDQDGSMWGINQNGDVISNVITGVNAADFVTGAQVAGTPGSTSANGLAIRYTLADENSGESLANTGANSDQALILSISATGALLAGASLVFFARRRTN